MRRSRKLVEAVQNIRHCPHNVHSDEKGRPTSITINYRLWAQMVSEYDSLIQELASYGNNGVLLDQGGTPFCTSCGRTL